MNPYGFVRLVGDGPLRGPVRLHQKYHGESGRITCVLTARTPLFVPEYHERRVGVHEKLRMFRDAQKRPVIPGTSLKGMIRNVAEAAANACLILPGSLRYPKGFGDQIEYAKPVGFASCRRLEELCAACRLFGVLNGHTVFAGSVTIQDAVGQPGYEIKEFTLPVLSSPKPRHTPFYSTKPGETTPPIRGRKFYYHRPLGALPGAKATGQNKTVEAVLPNAVFTFEVEYTNVGTDDLKLLLFALTLWDDTCHKVGMGKPIGLGSAKIEITKIVRLDYQARYHQLGAGWGDALTGTALADYIKKQVPSYRDGVGDNLLDLHNILRWDPSAADNLKYPDQGWFKTNLNVPLEGAP